MAGTETPPFPPHGAWAPPGQDSPCSASSRPAQLGPVPAPPCWLCGVWALGRRLSSLVGGRSELGPEPQCGGKGAEPRRAVRGRRVTGGITNPAQRQLGPRDISMGRGPAEGRAWIQPALTRQFPSRPSGVPGPGRGGQIPSVRACDGALPPCTQGDRGESGRTRWGDSPRTVGTLSLTAGPGSARLAAGSKGCLRETPREEGLARHRRLTSRGEGDCRATQRR